MGKNSEKNDEHNEESSSNSNKTESTIKHFEISSNELTHLMTLYKERDSTNADLKLLEEYGGIESIMKKLKTNPTNGITSLEFREEDFGSNNIYQEEIPTFFYFLLDAFNDSMIKILLVAGIIQIILGTTLSDNPETDWIDGVSILIAVIIVVLVGSITNYKKELKFHELNDINNNETKYKVIRGKVINNLTSNDLLVGDIIYINYGDIIPVDIILIENNGIKMDESSLTGECDSVKKEIYDICIEEMKNGKKCHSPFILSGTNCIEGNGKGVIIAVGENCQKNIIKRIIDNAKENNQTPLEKKLDDIAESISFFGMGAALLTLIALLIRFIIKYIDDNKNYNLAIQKGFDKKNLTNPKTQIPKRLLDIIILCVAIIAVAIPEGLPLAVTLSLAFSIKKLMDKNNLVRKMHACETMGGANYICTDKTGTLTKNEMNVYKMLFCDKEIQLEENLKVENVGKLDFENEINRKIREDYNKYFDNEDFWNLLKISIALNVDCSITKLDNANINGDLEIYDSKNKTDMAFIDFLLRLKCNVSNEREKYFL